MQIVERTPDKLVLTDKKNAFWGRIVRIMLTLGVIVGMFFGYRYLTKPAEIIALMGGGSLLLVLAILILVKESYTSVVEIDRISRELRITREDVFKKTWLKYGFDEIENVQLFEQPFEIPAWEVEVMLRDKTVVQLSASTTYAPKEKAAKMQDLIGSYLV